MTVSLVLDAWRPSTKKVYSMYLRKWMTFCVLKGIEVLKPTVQQVCMFLKNLSLQGLGYGALNAARSALATVLPPMEGHPMGAYERNPPQPKYKLFWDVNKVFDLLKRWGPNKNLTLKELALKLTILLLLVTSQRGQTILGLSLEGLELNKLAVFRLGKLLKHNRLGDALDSIILKPFEACHRLCVLQTLKAYIRRTEKLRKGEKQLLVSFAAPHKAISRDTLARWTLTMLSLAGVDVPMYKGHSTRGAWTSAAKRLGASTNLILKQAGWKMRTPSQSTTIITWNRSQMMWAICCCKILAKKMCVWTYVL